MRSALTCFHLLPDVALTLCYCSAGCEHDIVHFGERSAERRHEATEALEDLAAVTTHLKHLLLIGDLRAMLS